MDEVERCRGIEGGLPLEPAGREVKRLAVAVLCVARVEAGDRGIGGDRTAAFLVTAHGAVAEAKGEGGVGRAARPLERETRLLDDGVRLLLGLIGGLPLLPQFARLGVDQSGEFDERIVCGLDRGGAAGVEAFAEGDVAHLGAVDQGGRAVRGRLAGEDLLHEGIVEAGELREDGERLGEHHRLEIGVDRFLREELELERLAAGVAEFLEPLAVRLGQLVSRAQEIAGEAEGVTREGVPALELPITGVEPALRGHRLRDPPVGGLDLATLGPARHLAAERLLGRRLRPHDRRREEPGLPAVVNFARVLDAEEVVLRAAGVLLRARAPGKEQHLKALQPRDDVRVLHVAQEAELRQRELPVRAAGVSRHKREVPFLGTGRRPFEVIRDARRFAVLVRAVHRRIEVEAGKLEVIRVAAEESRLLFRRPHEAHVGVLLETVEVVRPALVKGHDVAAQAGLREGFLLDLRDHLAARRRRLAPGETRGHAGVHPRGHVLDRLQHIQLEVHRLAFLGGRPREEAVAQVVVPLVAQLLDVVRSHVVVRDHESVGRHERPRAAAVEAHRRFHQVLQPGVSEIEAVLGFHLRAGWRGVQPHALVGADRRRGKHEEQGREDNAEFHGGEQVADAGRWREEKAGGRRGRGPVIGLARREVMKSAFAGTAAVLPRRVPPNL